MHALKDLEPLSIVFLEKVQESGFVGEDVMSVRWAKDYLYGYVNLSVLFPEKMSLILSGESAGVGVCELGWAVGARERESRERE